MISSLLQLFVVIISTLIKGSFAIEGEICILGGVDLDVRILCFDGTSWTTVTTSLPAERISPEGAYLNGNPCVIGGWSDAWIPMDTVYCWIDNAWSTEPSLNFGRAYFAMIVINGKHCAAGGWGGSDHLSSVECWDGSAWQTDLVPDLIDTRSRHTAVYVKGYPCMISGIISGGNSKANNVECFVNDQWTDDEIPGTSGYIEYAETAIINDYSCIVAGSYLSGGYSDEIYCFNEESNSWDYDLVPNLNGRKDLSAVITLSDGIVCSISGRSQDTTECFDGSQWILNYIAAFPEYSSFHIALILDIPSLNGNYSPAPEPGEETPSPTYPPTASPTMSPTNSPTLSPTMSPTNSPTLSPTPSPTITPTPAPTTSPTTPFPTSSPTNPPTWMPTTNSPTQAPTASPAIIKDTVLIVIISVAVVVFILLLVCIVSRRRKNRIPSVITTNYSDDGTRERVDLGGNRKELEMQAAGPKV